ncbi:MAG: hypothetical protein R3344_03085 [Acidobacteriota bacterium]|nr:hypothetical protein [Acidobacteriota bacterium]
MAGVGLLFLLLVLLRIHGFSIPLWHDYIDGSPANEVVLGEPRTIRSDDWLVLLPLAMAQGLHDPSFPTTNTDIGEGQSMFLPVTSPIAHPLALFRPTTWGFFVGNDIGMAWMWWMQVLGLLVTWYFVLLVVTRQRVWLAALGSLVLVLSPFLQFWSFNAAPLIIYTGLCFLGAVAILTGETRRATIGGGALLGWSAGCFGLAVYPPYQVALAFLLIAMIAGFVLERREEFLSRRWKPPLTALGLAAAITFAAGFGFYLAAGDAIELIRGTAYPGERFSTGGEGIVWQLLNANLWLPMRADDYGAVRNISEAASFWLFFPVVGVGVVFASLRNRRRLDWLSVVLVLYCVVLSIYLLIGFPAWLSRITLFGMMTGTRALIGIGLADLLLLLRFLSRERVEKESPYFAIAVAVAWWLLLAIPGWPLHDAFPEIGLGFFHLAAGANGILAYFIVRRGFGAAVVGVMAGGLALCTLWFNPVVIGGSSYLLDNALSRKIVEIDREHDGATVWAAYGSVQHPNLFRVLGVRAVNGVMPLPQLAQWRRVDPEGDDLDIYNRYAHFRLMPGSENVRLELRQDDWVDVIANPTADNLGALGVTHVLIVSDRRPPDEQLPDLAYVASHRWNHIYRVIRN